jgi:hypothetical protein
LGCGLSDLELLGHALACHVARPPRRRRQTSLQVSWRILDERDVGQPPPRPPSSELTTPRHVLFMNKARDLALVAQQGQCRRR